MAAPTPQRTRMSFSLFIAPTMTRKASVRNGVVSSTSAFGLILSEGSDPATSFPPLFVSVCFSRQGPSKSLKYNQFVVEVALSRHE